MKCTKPCTPHYQAHCQWRESTPIRHTLTKLLGHRRGMADLMNALASREICFCSLKDCLAVRWNLDHPHRANRRLQKWYVFIHRFIIYTQLSCVLMCISKDFSLADHICWLVHSTGSTKEWSGTPWKKAFNLMKIMRCLQLSLVYGKKAHLTFQMHKV